MSVLNSNLEKLVPVSKSSKLNPLLLAGVSALVYVATFFFPTAIFPSAIFPTAICCAQETSGVEQRFVVHAERLLSLYDANKDGYLSQREVGKMEIPLKDKRFDLNGDRRLSKKEIVSAISRRSSPAKTEEQLIREMQDVEIARHVRAMLQRYDENKNGYLDVREFKKVPDQENWTDFDRNKLLTVAEMTRSLKEATRKIEEQINGSQLSEEVNDMYLKFLDASMKKNDLNGDGKIDFAEIEKGQWSGPIRSFDKNEDGFLSRQEMLKRYEKMFKVKLVESKPSTRKTESVSGLASEDENGKVSGGLLSTKGMSADQLASLGIVGFSGKTSGKNSAKSVKAKAPEQVPELTYFFLQHRKSSDVLRILNDVFGLPQKVEGVSEVQAAQMKQMIRQLSGGGRSKASSPSALKFGDDPVVNGIYVVAATEPQLDKISDLIDLIDRKSPAMESKTSTKSKSKSKANQAIAVKLYLMRAPVNASEELIMEAVKSIEESNFDDIGESVAESAKRLGVKKYEKLNINTVYLAKTDFNNTTFVGKPNDQDARSSRSAYFHSFVGANPLSKIFKGQVYATAIEGCTKLQLEIEKNDFSQAGDDPEEKKVQFNLTLDTTVAVQPDKPTVTTTSASDQNWILVTCVK